MVTQLRHSECSVRTPVTKLAPNAFVDFTVVGSFVPFFIVVLAVLLVRLTIAWLGSG